MFFGSVVVARAREAVGITDGFDEDVVLAGCDAVGVEVLFDLFGEPDGTGGACISQKGGNKYVTIEVTTVTRRANNGKSAAEQNFPRNRRGGF